MKRAHFLRAPKRAARGTPLVRIDLLPLPRRDGDVQTSPVTAFLTGPRWGRSCHSGGRRSACLCDERSGACSPGSTRTSADERHGFGTSRKMHRLDTAPGAWQPGQRSCPSPRCASPAPGAAPRRSRSVPPPPQGLGAHPAIGGIPGRPGRGADDLYAGRPGP